MSDAVITAIITALVSLIGIYAGIRQTQAKIKDDMKDNLQEIKSDLEKHQILITYRVDELQKSVQEHNNYARRLPVLEEKVAALEKAQSK